MIFRGSSFLVATMVLLNLFTMSVNADTDITGSRYGQRIEQGKLLH